MGCELSKNSPKLSKTGPLGSAVELILMHGDHRLWSVPELIPVDPSD